MKKLFVVLILILVALGLGVTVFIYSLGAPFDSGSSPYINMTPPENLTRTIHNPIAGHFTTFVTKSYESDHKYTLLEIQLDPGGENTPHYHDSFSETFIGVEGRTGVFINGETLYLESGDVAVAETGDVHYFFNDTDETVTFQVRIEPGSPGFEKALYILYGLANDGKTDEVGTPNDILDTAIFVAYSNTRASGPLSILNPLFGRLAGKAQRDGVESQLIERYYLSAVD